MTLSDSANSPFNAWATAVGQAMLSFGMIEYIVTLFLKKLPTEKVHGFANELLLVPKLDLLLGIVKGRDDPNFKDLVNALQKAKSLASQRNLLAHGPLLLDVHTNETDGTVSALLKIAGQRGRKSMTFEEVESFAKQAKALEKSLVGLYQDLSFPSTSNLTKKP